MLSSEEQKKTLRAMIRTRIGQLSPEERRQRDQALLVQLTGLQALREARQVAAYLPLADEPDLTPLYLRFLAEGRVLALPSLTSDRGLLFLQVTNLDCDLVPGEKGCLAPHKNCPPLRLASGDLLLVPGRAFTASGERLGRGGGWYDRTLSLSQALSVAPVYEEQMMEVIPLEEHDQRVSVIVTPERVLWNER